MTNHDTGDRATEQPRNPATAERPLDPLGDEMFDTQPVQTHAPTTRQAVTPEPEAYRQRDDDRQVVVRTEAAPRLDRIRWSSIWAGILVTLALYLFLQLSLVAAGIVDLSEATASAAWWSAGAALVAFLIGGVVTGATAVWRDAGDGLLHGIVMWAVGLVALIALAAFGGSVALGTFDTSEVFDEITSADVDAAVASGDAEETASWAILGLTSALVASALGATIGSKMWPRRRTDETEIRS
jgi:hypothetical protein